MKRGTNISPHPSRKDHFLMDPVEVTSLKKYDTPFGDIEPMKKLHINGFCEGTQKVRVEERFWWAPIEIFEIVD
ncbi:MAG TPA: hypothetical protein P5274_02995 [Candidatus Paceibacterota bacterium]|nr:hypothetical protein [Candidatus Paceibacterota bacterium]